MTRNCWKRNNYYVFDLDFRAEVPKLAANDGVVDISFGNGFPIHGNIIVVSATVLGYGVTIGS